ncbi:hypothetical protein BGZ60DRAFT_533278 [Tricladium varicosporioides]|nr:hypothetical protein BGZ60DRAFT_533278 [Hymenoscyphus varicosporioides]
MASAYRYESLGDENSTKGTNDGKFNNVVKYWREIAIICLVIICSALILELTHKPFELTSREKVQEYQITSTDTRWSQFHWNTNIYSSAHEKDETAINDAWSKIVPAHGFVAVDHEWAAQHNLPSSMSLPSNSSKGVYIIDAYHQIHCLTIIRKTFMELGAGKAPTIPTQHSKHCFDSLMQYIVCGTSGDTLLYTWGRNETGDGQVRKCIDWKSRMYWAHENTACYADSDHPVTLNDHFGHCGNNNDGIRLM